MSNGSAPATPTSALGQDCFQDVTAKSCLRVGACKSQGSPLGLGNRCFRKWFHSEWRKLLSKPQHMSHFKILLQGDGIGVHP